MIYYIRNEVDAVFLKASDVSPIIKSTPVDCSNYDIEIGVRTYKEEHFFLWYRWDQDGKIRKEIEIGVDIPGAGINYSHSFD